MDPSYLNLALAMAAFVGLHMAFPGSNLRARLVERWSENAYLGLYSLVAAVTLGWAIWAYIEAPVDYLWQANLAIRYVGAVLVLVAFILQVCALTVKNPTAVGVGLPGEQDPIPGIIRVTRHPLMWGIAIWALAHILTTGRVDTLIFFGGFAFLSLVGPARIDRRKARENGEDWRRLATWTSNLPFAAILSGRTKVTLPEIGWWRLLLGAALFAVVLFLHEWLFGMWPLWG